MGDQISIKIFLLILLLPAALLLPGCATVNTEHPFVITKELNKDEKVSFANVYFIRPQPYKSKGVADKTIHIEYQNQLLFSIAEGNYTLLRIKPSAGQIKVISETKFTNKLEPIKVWRARHYKFIEGKTYFIHLKRVDEEYRGIFYEPIPVKYQQAKKLAHKTYASGEAGKMPIDMLKDFSEPPASAVENQAPALPENIYEREPYLK